MRIFTRSTGLRTLSTTVAVILALPLSWKGLTGIYLWLSPYIMLNAGLALKSFAWLNLLAFAVLIFILFRKRWFCHNLCPAGWCFDKISAISKNKSFTYGRVPAFGKWLAVISLASATAGIPLFIFFDPLAIFNGLFTVFYGRMNFIAILSLSGFVLLLGMHLFLPGIWCAKLCPLGGFQLMIEDLKNSSVRFFRKNEARVSDYDSGRRYIIMSGMGLAAGMVIPKFLKPGNDNIIRPPATVDPSLLYSLCSRCGSCNKVCPTGIIIPYTGTGNIPAWMTPSVRFRTGYCLETCNLCSVVCPTGAISLFSPGAKNRLFMGTALVNIKDCRLFSNRECVKCKESCRYEAIDFRKQGSLLKMMPVVNKDKCVGCGACEVVCPEGCIEIKPGDFNDHLTDLSG
jgi:ferredoxin-type protein NapF